MANSITGHLAAPHACVRLEVSRWFRNSWRVRYSAKPSELVAAGIVDGDMVRKILARKGGARVGGPHVLAFKLRPTQAERVPDYLLWGRDETVVLEWKCGTYFLTKLPGVSELFPNGAPDDEQDDELTAEQLVTQFPAITMGMAFVARTIAERIGASNVRNADLRVRCVGQRQRPAQWLSIGKVIAPNFARGAA